MKKIILLASLAFSLNAIAQDKFELKPEGFTDYVITEVPNKTAANLYSGTIAWIVENHLGYTVHGSNHQDDKSIILTGEAPDLIAINSMGRHTYRGQFTVKVEFFENQYKFDFLSIEQYHEASGKWISIDMNNKDLFNKKGELRSMNKYLPEIATFLDKVNNDLKTSVSK